MKKLLRAAALLLCAVCVVSSFTACRKEPGGEDTAATTASANETGAQPAGGFRLTLSDVSVPSGSETFSVSVSMSGCPGLSVLILTVAADDRFTVMGGKKSDGLFQDLDTGDTPSGFNLVFSADRDMTADGELATVTFNCAGVPDGEYDLVLYYRDSSNSAFEEILPEGMEEGKIAARAKLRIG